MTDKKFRVETYEAVAHIHGLDEAMARRFILYMRNRWSSEEQIQCLYGYAGEWAERFKSGIEFESSDEEGRQVLRSLIGI